MYKYFGKNKNKLCFGILLCILLLVSFKNLCAFSLKWQATRVGQSYLVYYGDAPNNFLGFIDVGKKTQYDLKPPLFNSGDVFYMSVRSYSHVTKKLGILKNTSVQKLDSQLLWDNSKFEVVSYRIEYKEAGKDKIVFDVDKKEIALEDLPFKLIKRDGLKVYALNIDGAKLYTIPTRTLTKIGKKVLSWDLNKFAVAGYRLNYRLIKKDIERFTTSTIHDLGTVKEVKVSELDINPDIDYKYELNVENGKSQVLYTRAVKAQGDILSWNEFDFSIVGFKVYFTSEDARDSGIVDIDFKESFDLQSIKPMSNVTYKLILIPYNSAGEELFFYNLDLNAKNIASWDADDFSAKTYKLRVFPNLDTEKRYGSREIDGARESFNFHELGLPDNLDYVFTIDPYYNEYSGVSALAAPILVEIP